jgi:hypothetical protein
MKFTKNFVMLIVTTLTMIVMSKFPNNNQKVFEKNKILNLKFIIKHYKQLP